jgi:hypothetical protein
MFQLKKPFFFQILPLIWLISCAALQSCLMNYPVTTTNTPPKPSKEEQVKQNISNYVTSKFVEKGSYESVQFGKLFVFKPKEIEELDQLIEVRNMLPTMEENYGSKLDSVIQHQDRLIENKKNEIKSKNIYPLYEISHLFIIKISDTKYEMYEFDFSLYPNYSVKDVKQLLYLELNEKEFKSFQHLTNQEILFVGEPEKDIQFYSQFYTAIEAEQHHKPELIKTILRIIEYIKKYDKFDENDFCQIQAKEWVVGRPEYSQVKSEGFVKNELTPVIETDSTGYQKLKGYQLTYLFSSKENEGQEITKLDFEFDLNFVIIKVSTSK